MELDHRQLSTIIAYATNSSDLLPTDLSAQCLNLNSTAFVFQLNNVLRGQVDIMGVENYCSVLDSCFEQNGSLKPSYVYRVCNYKEMLRYLTDTNYVDFGYISTSTNIEKAYGFFELPKAGYEPALLKIKLSQNTSTLVFDETIGTSNGNYESEVLIKRRSWFSVNMAGKMSKTRLFELVENPGIFIPEYSHYIEMDFISHLP